MEEEFHHWVMEARTHLGYFEDIRVSRLPKVNEWSFHMAPKVPWRGERWEEMVNQCPLAVSPHGYIYTEDLNSSIINKSNRGSTVYLALTARGKTVCTKSQPCPQGAHWLSGEAGDWRCPGLTILPSFRTKLLHTLWSQPGLLFSHPWCV